MNMVGLRICDNLLEISHCYVALEIDLLLYGGRFVIMNYMEFIPIQLDVRRVNCNLYKVSIWNRNII